MIVHPEPPLEQRMALALGEIMRGVWHHGWDESDIRDCMRTHNLIHDATADEAVCQEGWAQDFGMTPGDPYERLNDELLALEKAAQA